MACASAENEYIRNPKAIPSTPRLRIRRCARYLSAKPPKTGASTAARLMIAMTIPASAALPVDSVTKGGISSEMNAAHPAPAAINEIIHHSKERPFFAGVSDLVIPVFLLVDKHPVALFGLADFSNRSYKNFWGCPLDSKSLCARFKHRLSITFMTDHRKNERAAAQTRCLGQNVRRSPSWKIQSSMTRSGQSLSITQSAALTLLTEATTTQAGSSRRRICRATLKSISLVTNSNCISACSPDKDAGSCSFQHNCNQVATIASSRQIVPLHLSGLAGKRLNRNPVNQ